MKLKVIPLLLAGSALLAGCQQNASTFTAPIVKKEDAVAKVNGKYISKLALETLTSEIKQRARGQNIPTEKLIDELVRRELLVQQAKSKNLGQTPEIQQRLVMMQNGMLSQLAIEDFIEANPVTDADLQAEYDKQIAEAAEQLEFKARHILVETEPEGTALIVKLDKGADFAELAKTTSTGPSGAQGGDLGWFTADRMTPPFSEAVAALENGAYTKAPVKTQFGWHVILREDSRDVTPPPLEAIKAQLKPLVQRQKLTDYLDSLKNDAKIEILLPAEEPVAVVETVTEEVTPAKDTVTEKVEVVVETVKKEATPTKESVTKAVKEATTPKAAE